MKLDRALFTPRDASGDIDGNSRLERHEGRAGASRPASHSHTFTSDGAEASNCSTATIARANR